MANKSQNEDFHVLDDFVCEAIYDPAVPRITSTSKGQNEGMRVVDEIVVDLSIPNQNEVEKQKPQQD